MSYLLYTSDIPKLEYNTVATFADDTSIMAVETNYEEATRKLQSCIDQINAGPNFSELISLNVPFTKTFFCMF